VDRARILKQEVSIRVIELLIIGSVETIAVGADDGVWFDIPQATEWQRIGNPIDAAPIFAGADFVSVL